MNSLQAKNINYIKNEMMEIIMILSLKEIVIKHYPSFFGGI